MLLKEVHGVAVHDGAPRLLVRGGGGEPQHLERLYEATRIVGGERRVKGAGEEDLREGEWQMMVNGVRC